MESLSPPPNKKVRYFKNIAFPVIECKREFKLPQQFPSMKIPFMKINAINKEKNAGNVAIVSTSPKSPKDVIGNKVLLTSEVKKLRMKSKNGTDLGEIKVKFLPSSDVLNTKTITLSKSSMNNMISRPIKFSIVLPNDTDIAPCPKKDNKDCKISEKPVSSPSKPVIIYKHLNRLNQGNNMHNTQTVNDIAPKHIKTPTDLVVLDIKENGNLSVKKKGDLDNTKESTPKDSIPGIINKTVSNVEKSPKLKDHWQLAKSKFPVVKCEKLLISKSKVNVTEFNKLSMKAVKTKKNEPNTKISKPTEQDVKVQTILTTTNPIVEEPHYLTQDNHPNKTLPENNVSTVSSDESTIVNRDSNNFQKKDCAVTSVTVENVYSEMQNVFNDINNKIVSCLHKETCNNKNVQNKELDLQNTVTSTNDKEPVNIAADKEKLSQHWNIIKEALISVKDEELRAKALQALADCGIGVAKNVPITPPEKLKTVHDSQIQTDVFGLLDLEHFVLVEEAKPNLERIKQIKHSTFNNITNKDVPLQSKTTCNYLDNEDLLPRLRPMYSMENTFDLDKYFNEVFSENTDANRVKQVLSTSHSLCKKVSTQLQKDLEAMQQWDENGMLNIHRAVVHNNLRELQRLLLVLKASKTSIDIVTEDEMTSLELAIKSNSSRDIVKTLLKAGAQPTSTELLHKSAIILASKLSSPLLPDLLKYVSDCTLLDRADSEGFAPLHYCALYGNFEGVAALIEAGANVNIRDSRSGRSPFFHALEHNRISIAKKLLENGATAKLPNFSGQSVLSLIDEVKNVALKTALKQTIF